jgi:uncharacterized protein
MALFVLTGFDHPGALDKRLAARPDHLAYLERRAAMVKLAGPLLGADDQVIGSLLIVEAESRAEVEAFAAGDPYGMAGLFERVEIRGFRVSVGALA